MNIDIRHKGQVFEVPLVQGEHQLAQHLEQVIDTENDLGICYYLDPVKKAEITPMVQCMIRYVTEREDLPPKQELTLAQEIESRETLPLDDIIAHQTESARFYAFHFPDNTAYFRLSGGDAPYLIAPAHNTFSDIAHLSEPLSKEQPYDRRPSIVALEIVMEKAIITDFLSIQQAMLTSGVLPENIAYRDEPSFPVYRQHQIGLYLLEATGLIS